MRRDGKLLLSTGREGTLNLWNLDNAKVVASMQEGAMGFQVVAFHPDGTSFATGGIDRNITLWDFATTMEMHKAK